MKFIFVVAVFLLAVLAIQPTQSAKICVINVKNCSTNSPVCGRYGHSNLCKKFQNKCVMDAANCSDTAGYTSVIASQCNGIAVNQRRACVGLSSSISSGGGIFGTNTNNVYPIVINAGK